MSPVRSPAVVRYAAPGTGGLLQLQLRYGVEFCFIESPVRRAPGTGGLPDKLSQII